MDNPVSSTHEMIAEDIAVERNVMVTMRDGVRLSVYLYTPEGEGPWPVIFEQRYASLRAKGTRESALSQPSGISYAIPGVHVREMLDRHR